MQSILADAGPLIALFLQKDAYHQQAMAFAKNCDIITIDRKDFAVYRTDKGKPFRNCF